MRMASLQPLVLSSEKMLSNSCEPIPLLFQKPNTHSMNQTSTSWHAKLVAATNGLAEELGLDDMSTQKLREFILTQAKEEYMAGNRSGIRWARTNPPKTAQMAS